MEIMTLKQAAVKWGIKHRRVQELIRAKRIPQAYKIERIWVMPVDTPKPPDLRKLRTSKKQQSE